MKINKCFILGAGEGTRMERIGKKLPKILWPIFEKTLLELQIDFAKKWGCQEFFMNVCHLHDQVEDFITEKNIKIRLFQRKKS